MEGSTLQQSFIALKEHFVGSPCDGDSANPAQLVLFAENAFKEGCVGAAAECLELYFSLNPPTNQFLVRAYLCQALTASTSPAEPEETLQKAVECIVAAVDIAKKSECYHFLVHNASVLLWQISRPHRKPGWSCLCLAGWQSVAKAQEVCKNNHDDPSWRLDILIGLVESQVDSGLSEEALKTCRAALQLARKRVPERLISVMRLSVLHGLGDGKSFEKEMKSVPEFVIFSKLQKLRHSLSVSSVRQGDVESELRKLVESTLEISSTSRKTPGSSKQPPPPPLSLESKAALLLEIAQVCVEQGLVELCSECVTSIPGEAKGARLDLLKRAVTSQLSLLKIKLLPPYSRTVVEARVQSIAELENCITAAQRMGDQEIVQHVGVILWGVCLPLLQPNLRTRLSRTLATLASALEQVDSALHSVCCLVHIELAKVCADQNQLQTALEHINKAKELDRECEWSEQLRQLGERLRLRSELYHTPPSPLLQASQTLEQIQSSGECGSKEELRAVLVGVGTLLALDHFKIATGDKLPEPPVEKEEVNENRELGMDGEVGSTVKEEGEGAEEEGEKKIDGSVYEGVPSVSGDSEYPGLKVGREGEEVCREGNETWKGGEKWYEVVREQVLAHKEDTGTTDDADRCRLWADLAKLSRKHRVWDVAFVASKFCLVYDDKRWTVQAVKIDEKPSKTGSKKKLQKSSSLSVNRSRSDASARTSSSVAGLASVPISGPAEEREAGRKRGRERVCRDLLRTLAEIHFIHAECAVYQLKESGHELGHGVPLRACKQESEGATQSVEWPGQLSSDAYASFLRAAELGCTLSEQWLVANAATYLYNYSHHLLQSNSLTTLVPVFRPLLANMLTVREHDTHTIGDDMMCRLSAILAGGLVQKWIPLPPDPTKTDSSTLKTGGRKSGRGTATGKKKVGGVGETQLQVSPDAEPELKEALSVCERGLGASPTLTVRANLLAVWVQCRQLLQQPIPSKTLGVEKNKADGDDVVGCCRAVVAVEMLGLMGNRIWDFPDCPTLTNAFELVSGCDWSSGVMLELELLTRIARQALQQTNYPLVSECASRALLSVERSCEPAEEGKKKKKTKRDVSEVRRERELLSFISSLHGQGLMGGGGGKVASVRAAMEAFLQSAKYGRDAGSYGRVLEASRHYWNVCRGLTSSPLDRETLQQPLAGLLSILTSFLPRRSTQSSVGKEEASEEDLKLYVAMYKIVFQVYIDKGEWEEGLEAIEKAMWATPKTIHQDLAELKLIFKSQMGRSVAGVMVRFQDVSEEERARLWYKVACNSTNPQQQLTALQNSIDTLTDPNNMWLRVDYILAFSEWLYSHQFPIEEALGHLQWALSLLTERGGGGEQGEEGEEGGGGGGGGEGVDGPECRVLERAVCVLVMMAQLQGRGSTGHRESCLAAVAYCNLIWKATLEVYSQSVSGKCDIELPTTVHGWTSFTASEGLRDYIKSSNSESSINTGTIRAPALTCHYLAALSDELCACCLQPLAVPVETLQLLITDSLVTSLPVSQLVHLRLVSLCTALGARTGREEHLKQAGPVYLNPEDLARSHAEMAHYRQKMDVVQREESKRTHCKPRGARPSHSLTTTSTSPERPVLRQVWAEEAAILVKQGQLQVSRELLKEVRLSAQVFEDGHTMGRMLITKASLAAAEKRVDKCIHCVCEAQRYPLSLDQWEEGMSLLLTVATLQGGSHCDSCLAAVSDAVSSLKSELLDMNLNDRARVESVEAVLFSRLAVISAEALFDGGGESVDEIEKLCEEMATHTQSLLQMGRHVAAAGVMLSHARITRRLAGPAQDMSKLLKAVELLQGAVSTVQSVLEDALSLCPLSDGLCHPEEGVLVEAGQELADTLLLVAEEYIADERWKRSRQQKKSCIEKMIDEYVQVSPQFSSAQEAWNTVASNAAERVLATLTSIHTCSTVQSQKQLKAKCVYGIGRALLLLSDHASPDGPMQWREVGSHNRTTHAVPADESGTTAEDDSTATQQLSRHSTLSQVMRGEEAALAEGAESKSIQLLAKASQSMGQALSMALQVGDKEMAAVVALKIVDSCGACEPETSAFHLALYQSCVASQHMLCLLRQVQPDPSESKLAALLHQHSQLTHSSLPTLHEAVTTELSAYVCWQRLQVTENHLDLLRCFPPHFRFILLQHSEDKSQLYSAYLIPPQPPLPAPKKGQPPPIAVSEVPVIRRVSVSAEDRERVVEMVNSSKRLHAQQLLKSTGDPPSSGCAMNQQFNSIRETMENYLSPALDPIYTALQEEKSDSELTVVLLVDWDLLQLPLEALNLLQSENIKAVARDFSLQMLCHRFVVEDEDAKKRDKFQLQPSFLQANPTNFQYILDPRSELKDSDKGEMEQPTEMIVSQINAFPKVTSKWSGHKGSSIENAISSSQWYPILKQCSGFLFFGGERFLAHFPPRQLVSLSMQDCGIAMVMDHVQTLESALKQSKLDVEKTAGELNTEESLQAAALLSLAGVGSLVSRQWHSTVNNCADALCSYIKQLLTEAVGVADMRWREVKDSSQQEQSKEIDSKSELPSIQSTERIDSAFAFNCIVYGLPHLALNLPTP